MFYGLSQEGMKNSYELFEKKGWLIDYDCTYLLKVSDILEKQGVSFSDIAGCKAFSLTLNGQLIFKVPDDENEDKVKYYLLTLTDTLKFMIETDLRKRARFYEFIAPENNNAYSTMRAEKNLYSWLQQLNMVTDYILGEHDFHEVGG